MGHVLCEVRDVMVKVVSEVHSLLKSIQLNDPNTWNDCEQVEQDDGGKPVNDPDIWDDCEHIEQHNEGNLPITQM